MSNIPETPWKTRDKPTLTFMTGQYSLPDGAYDNMPAENGAFRCKNACSTKNAYGRCLKINIVLKNFLCYSKAVR